MPIVGYRVWPPVIDKNTGDHVRFTMSDGFRLISCRVSIIALQDCFGDNRSDPIDLFETSQAEIEDAASRNYDRHGVINGLVELTEHDFF